MPFIAKKAMESGEPLPGWVGHFCQSPEMSFVQYEIAPGAAIHEHRHDNEEVWIVVSGKLEVTVAGEARVADAGDVVVVPRNAPHFARAITPARAIVVDHPARDGLPGGKSRK